MADEDEMIPFDIGNNQLVGFVVLCAEKTFEKNSIAVANIQGNL